MAARTCLVHDVPYDGDGSGMCRKRTPSDGGTCAIVTLVGRMCPYCLMWSEDDDEACPGSCNESDDMDAAPAKRFRIYRTGQ